MGEILRYLGTILIATGALVWLAKVLFRQLMARDLEKFKTELQAKSDMEVERFKHELTLVASEHQTRFARLHSDRAEVVRDLYRLLDKTDGAFNALLAPLKYVGPEGTDAMMQRLTREASEAGNAFFDYFNQNRIFLDSELCSELGALEGRFRRSWSEYVPFGDPSYSPERKDRLKIWNDFKQEVPELRGKIEDRFRELLGVTAPRQSR